GKRTAGASIPHGAVPVVDAAIDLDLIPAFSMTYITDRQVVMHAPEEGHRIEALSAADHVARGGLSLALRDDPMLDTDVIFGVWVRPARNIAGCEDARHTGLEILVDRDTAIGAEPGAHGKADIGPH